MNRFDQNAPVRIRSLMRQRRSAVPSEDARAAAGRAAELVEAYIAETATAHSTAPKELGVYLPVEGEISPLPSAELLRRSGWSTWLPVVGVDNQMRFARWDPGDPLQPNRFGIGEPGPDARTCSASQLGVVIVPCVAVDGSGTRLGMGAGFYDRALAGAGTALAPAPGRVEPDQRQVADPGNVPLLIGLVFDFQITEPLVPEPWDIAMHVVVSEQRVIPRGRSR